MGDVPLMVALTIQNTQVPDEQGTVKRLDSGGKVRAFMLL
jgi:hypothetical protein